jgi:hypothetical protein
VIRWVEVTHLHDVFEFQVCVGGVSNSPASEPELQRGGAIRRRYGLYLTRIRACISAVCVLREAAPSDKCWEEMDVGEDIGKFVKPPAEYFLD